MYLLYSIKVNYFLNYLPLNGHVILSDVTFKLHKRESSMTHINHPKTFLVGMSGTVNKPSELLIRLQVYLHI